MKYLLAIIVYLLFFSFPVVAGTIDPNTPDSKYVEYGSKFKCIVKLTGKTSQDKLYVASAVVIDKNWIITAAHVVSGAKSVKIIDYKNKEHCITEIVIHEEFKENIFGKSDIAVGYSPTDIDSDFYPELYSDSDEVGKLCCMAGYGVTGNFNTGSKYSDENKRAGSNLIDKIDRDLLICSPSRSYSQDRTSLEFLISHGDSGGGLFIDKKLAGINSCVIAEDGKPNSTYTDESGHTRISKFNSWIRSQLIKNSPKLESGTILIDNNTCYRDILLISLCIAVNLGFFIMGYVWCRITNTVTITSNGSKLDSRNKMIQNKPPLVDIDSSKVVVSIKTEGLEKKYDQLGDVKQTQESIDNSVNKLKNLRK